MLIKELHSSLIRVCSICPVLVVRMFKLCDGTMPGVLKVRLKFVRVVQFLESLLSEFQSLKADGKREL